jgi:uncharacterized protein YecE (DUF72 family)
MTPSEKLATYDFRDVHPSVHFGTASDRYAGWIGQIYPQRYATDFTARKRKLGGQVYEERVLPVASVTDYFEHFGVLELDFPFYRPLLEADGEPSNNYRALEQYAAHAPEEAQFLLKAPQQVSARIVRSGSGFEANETYLDASVYLDRFLEPAAELLGERLRGVVFEQEYQRSGEVEPAEHLSGLDDFFERLALEGADFIPTHLEIRSPHLHTPEYFDFLRARGLGYVYSHWTWLPMIREQWKAGGGAPIAATGADGVPRFVARLLTPRDTKYADAYAAAYPFDKPAPALSETPGARAMVLDAVALAMQAIRHGAEFDLILNNRAYGNSPALAQVIGERLLRELAK